MTPTPPSLASRPSRSLLFEGLNVDIHDGDGPPVVLVHGMMAGRGLWAANLDSLRTYLTPVVVELYGHGRSQSPDDGERYTPASYSARFDRLRRSLGVDRWLLIGQSLGASLTLRYAIDHPEDVIAHAFTNSASALNGESWRTAVLASVGPQAARVRASGLEYLAKSRTNPLRSRSIVPSVRAEFESDVALMNPTGIANSMEHTTPTTSIRERLAENRAPCLLVAGANEKGFADGCAFAEAHMSMLTVERVDARHSPNAEIPDTFNDVVERFFRTHVSRG